MATSKLRSPRVPGFGGHIMFMRMSRSRWRENLGGYLCISPWIIGFLAFTVGPLVASLYYSFTQYTMLRVPQWVGLNNYRTALSYDRLFWLSVSRTVLWSLTTVPLGIVGSFIAALLLDRDVRGKTIWRICFFLPSLTPQIAATLIWVWILQPDVGVLNSLIKMLFGVKGPLWLVSPSWALPRSL